MYIVTRRWLYSTVLICVALSVFYGMYAVYSIPRGGGFTGYTLGIAGTLLIVALMLLPVRKRQYQKPVGRLDLWMRTHACLGIITGVVVGMHAGFRVAGAISLALTVLFVLALLSGLMGTILYEKLPYAIARMGNQTFRAQSILDNMAQMMQELDNLKAAHSAQFGDTVSRAFIRRRFPDSINPIRLLPWLIRQFRDRDTQETPAAFHEPEQTAYRMALILMDRHQQLDRQLFYQRVIRQWLWTHIPLSAAMVTLLIVHIVSELYY